MNQRMKAFLAYAIVTTFAAKHVVDRRVGSVSRSQPSNS